MHALYDLWMQVKSWNCDVQFVKICHSYTLAVNDSSFDRRRHTLTSNNDNAQSSETLVSYNILYRRFVCKPSWRNRYSHDVIRTQLQGRGFEPRLSCSQIFLLYIFFYIGFGVPLVHMYQKKSSERSEAERAFMLFLCKIL